MASGYARLRRRRAQLAVVVLLATLLAARAAADAATESILYQPKYEPAGQAITAEQLACGPPYCPNFVFAIHDNKLYARAARTFGDRAWHTLYLLLALLERRRVPDVYGSIGNVNRDALVLEGDPDAHFAFFRDPGASRPLLWPDFDYFGSVQKFIAPHEPLARALADAMPPWEHRSDTVFWAGNVDRGVLRGKYARCAADNPGLVRIHNYDGQYAASKYVHLRAGVALKPANADLRQLLRHKYLVYLPGATWSTSLKRIMAAGAVVVLPADDPHETVLTHVMRGCDDCFLYYDARDICGSLLSALRGVDDDESRRRAQRLHEYVTEHVTDEAMYDWMSAQLQTAAAAQAGRPHVVEELREALPLVTCASIRSKHAAVGDAFQLWQLDEWLDDACVAKPAPYLATTAV